MMETVEFGSDMAHCGSCAVPLNGDDVRCRAMPISATIGGEAIGSDGLQAAGSHVLQGARIAENGLVEEGS